MQNITGKIAFGGIAIGKIALFEKGDDPVKRKTIEDTNEEIKRFENAKEKAKEETGIDLVLEQEIIK